MRKLASIIFSRLFVTGLIILIQLAVFITFWLRLVEYSFLSGSLMMFLSLIIVIYISSKNEPSAYKIGWIILIMLFPILGGMMYLIFGNKRPVRKKKARLTRYKKEYEKYMKADKDLEVHINKKDPRFAGTVNYLQEAAGFPASNEGSVDYYPLGDDAFPAMLRDLKKAEKFIFMEYFIIERGEMWDSIYEILKEKAQNGVDVRLIYDDVGSLSTLEANFHKKMEAAGIKCFPFNKFVPLLSIAMNHRDHRKITVIDGRVAFTGGYNLADEYINSIEKYGHWKDTGLRIRGGAVRNFTVMFLEMWNAFRHEDEDIEKFIYGEPPGSLADVNLPVRTDECIIPYGDSPLDDELTGQNIYLEIINQAKDYVYIFTPYLIVDNDMINALTLAAKRGVDVRIVTPGQPDKRLVYNVTRSYYPQLMREGVKIFKYSPGFLHAKSFISDDKLAVVGTINLDFRSLCLHFECGVLIYKGQIIEDIKKDFIKTLGESDQIDPKKFHKKKRWRFFDHLIRLFAPLL